jgi:hypothetical protein
MFIIRSIFTECGVTAFRKINPKSMNSVIRIFMALLKSEEISKVFDDAFGDVHNNIVSYFII